MSWEKKYPPSEGWIRADLTLTKAEPVTDSLLASIKKTFYGESHEIGQVEQHGKRLTIIARTKRLEVPHVS